MNRTNKKVHQKIELTFSLQKKSLYKLFGRKKKFNPEIWSQKYTLGRWSWRPLSKKSSYRFDFENSWAALQLLQNIKPTRILLCTSISNVYIYIYTIYMYIYIYILDVIHFLMILGDFGVFFLNANGRTYGWTDRPS